MKVNSITIMYHVLSVV